MKARIGLIVGAAGLTAGIGVFGTQLSRAEAAGVDGAGVATIAPLPFGLLPCSPFAPLIGWPCSPKRSIAYTDVGATNNNMTVKVSANEKLNIVDPGVVIVGTLCSGVGEVTCDIKKLDLYIQSGEGDDVIRLKQTTTFARIDCGGGYDRVFRGNAHAITQNCEEVA